MQGGELIAEGAYGCVFHPSIKCKGKSSSNIISKIQTNDETVENELFLGNIIAKIPDYEQYFIPVQKKCTLNISKMKVKDKKECSFFKTYKNEKFVNMVMPYINGSEINVYIRKKNKLVVQNILYGFPHLLNGLSLLHNNGICHHDLSESNILLDEDRNIPVIIDFGLSIYVSDIKNYEKYFYMFNELVDMPWCLEVHYLNYILHKNKTPTVKEIKNIASKFSQNFKNILSSKFVERYEKNCIEYLSTFLNMETEQVKKEIIKHWRKWDICALNYLYLDIFSRLADNNKLTIELTKLFVENVHPNPNRIKNIKDTLTSFEKIMKKYGTVENYTNLVDNLKK